MDAVTSSNQVVGSIPQLAQAMAGFPSGGGGADSLNPNSLGADTSKQQFLTAEILPGCL
jgi:hypothetical protein